MPLNLSLSFNAPGDEPSTSVFPVCQSGVALEIIFSSYSLPCLTVYVVLLGHCCYIMVVVALVTTNCACLCMILCICLIFVCIWPQSEDSINLNLQHCLTFYYFELLFQYNINCMLSRVCLDSEFSFTFWAYKLDSRFTVFFFEGWQPLLFSTLSQMFWLLFVLPLKLDFMSLGAQFQGQQIWRLTGLELGKITQTSFKLI